MEPKIETRKMAVIYCRCSSEDSAANGITIAAQESVCQETAKQAGFTILEVIKDEGKSGGDMDRAGLRRLRELAEQKAIDAIFMIHSDRLARNAHGHIELMDLFDAKKIEVRCVYQQTLDRTTAGGYMMDTMFAAIAEHYRRVISEKTKSAIGEKAKEGWYPGVPPIGYVCADNLLYKKGEISRRIIVPDIKSAPFVTEIFSMYATGNYNVGKLCEMAYQKGFRTKRGGKVADSIVYRFLQNSFYVGEMTWGDIHLPVGKHTPLIDRSTFDRVQAVLAAHNQYATRDRKYTFLLRGLVICAEHRTNHYTAELHEKPSGLKFGYYHCSNGSGCAGGCVPTETLEDRVAELFRNLKFGKVFIDRIIAKAQGKFNAQREGLDTKIKSLMGHKVGILAKMKIAEDKLFKGVLLDKDFERIRDDISEETQSLDSEIKRLELQRNIQVDIAQEILLFTRDIFHAYLKAKPIVKRHYHGIFFDKIYVYKGEVQEVKYSKLFESLVNLNCLIHEKPKQNGDAGIIRTKWGATSVWELEDMTPASI
jgi:DNA invertase Pin-like site-specific DNA recombinase